MPNGARSGKDAARKEKVMKARGVRVRCPISSTPLNTEGLAKLRDGGDVLQGLSQAHFNTERYKCPNCGLSVDSYYTKEKTVKNTDDGTESVIPPIRKWTSHSYVVPNVSVIPSSESAARPAEVPEVATEAPASEVTYEPIHEGEPEASNQ